MWEAIRSNRRKSRWVIFLMGLLLIALGLSVGFYFDPQIGWAIGAAAALVLWMIMTLVALFSGDSVLLASARAHEIRKEDSPQLWNVVEEMTIASGLGRMPKVFVIDDEAPNAFAVGRKPEKAAVAVTSGMLRRLSRDELQGVVAHEIGHIKNLDVRFMTIAAVMVASITLISDIFIRSLWFGAGSRRSPNRGGGQGAAIIAIVAILIAILAPIGAQLLYFACSRRREYLADACGALYTRYPAGLASALEKISSRARAMTKTNRAIAPMYIINPLQGLNAHSWNATHPPLQKRIAVLRAMGSGAGFIEYDAAFKKVLGDKGGCIGQQTLAASKPVAAEERQAPSRQDAVQQSEQVNDMLDRLSDFLLLYCACGVRIKLPPDFTRDQVKCPRCGRVNHTPRPTEEGGEESASTPAGSQKNLTYQRRGTGWESFECTCGGRVQISPKFAADAIDCRKCGRSIKVLPA